MSVSIHEKIGLAELFGERVRKTLAPKQLLAVCELNAMDGPHSDVCHTHDFCDANVLMGDAWQAMFGSEFPMADEATDSDMELWNDAWCIAKAAQFFAADYHA